MMIAGFQGNIERSAAGVIAGERKGIDLRMWAAELLMPAFADDLAVFDNDRSDHGVGFDVAFALGGQLQSALHHSLIELIHHRSL